VHWKQVAAIGVLAGVLNVAGFGQEKKPAAPEQSPTAKPSGPEQEFRQIQQELFKARQKFSQEYRAAQTDQEKRTALYESFTKQQREFADKFLQLAEAHPKTPTAARAFAQVIQLNPKAGAAAREKLLTDFIDDRVLAEVILTVGRDRAFLEMVAQKSTNRDVQGVARFFEMLAVKGRELTDENAPTVVPMMERLQKEFGDVQLVYAGGRAGPKIGPLVEGELFAFQNLRIGKVAPDIAGEDIDGVTFKLSDYRGKVVVIDFWGDW
jgi:hypothetical protein